MRTQIARFDFSYGTTEWHLETQRALEEAIAITGLQCAVMLDILGTEVLVTGRWAAFNKCSIIQ